MPVLYEKRDHVAHVTLNRPEVLNAFNRAMHQSLREVWMDFREDDDAWVALITGAGDRAFSAGQDMKEAGEGRSQGTRRSFWETWFGGDLQEGTFALPDAGHEGHWNARWVDPIRTTGDEVRAAQQTGARGHVVDLELSAASADGQAVHPAVGGAKASDHLRRILLQCRGDEQPVAPNHTRRVTNAGQLDPPAVVVAGPAGRNGGWLAGSGPIGSPEPGPARPTPARSQQWRETPR